jgi:hypothetical protein
MRTQDFQDGLYDELKESGLQSRAVRVSSVQEHSPGPGGGRHQRIMLIAGVTIMSVGAVLVAGELLTSLSSARAGAVVVRPVDDTEEATPLTSKDTGSRDGLDSEI